MKQRDKNCHDVVTHREVRMGPSLSSLPRTLDQALGEQARLPGGGGGGYQKNRGEEADLCFRKTQRLHQEGTRLEAQMI